MLVTGHLHREKSVPSLRTVSHCIAEYLCMSCHSKHLVCFASHDVCCLFTFSACSVSLTTKVRMVKKQRSASRVGKSGGRLQLCRKQGESAQLTKVWAQFLMTSIQETAYSKHSVGFWAGIVNLLVMCFLSDVMGALQMQGHLQRETSFASVRNMSRCGVACLCVCCHRTRSRGCEAVLGPVAYVKVQLTLSTTSSSHLQQVAWMC